MNLIICVNIVAEDYTENTEIQKIQSIQNVQKTGILSLILYLPVLGKVVRFNIVFSTVYLYS